MEFDFHQYLGALDIPESSLLEVGANLRLGEAATVRDDVTEMLKQFSFLLTIGVFENVSHKQRSAGFQERRQNSRYTVDVDDMMIRSCALRDISMENGPVCKRIAYDYDIKLLAVQFGTIAFQLCADGSHLFRGYTLEAYAQIILIDLQ